MQKEGIDYVLWAFSTNWPYLADPERQEYEAILKIIKKALLHSANTNETREKNCLLYYVEPCRGVNITWRA